MLSESMMFLQLNFTNLNKNFIALSQFTFKCPFYCRVYKDKANNKVAIHLESLLMRLQLHSLIHSFMIFHQLINPHQCSVVLKFGPLKLSSVYLATKICN